MSKKTTKVGDLYLRVFGEENGGWITVCNSALCDETIYRHSREGVHGHLYGVYGDINRWRFYERAHPWYAPWRLSVSEAVGKAMEFAAKRTEVHQRTAENAAIAEEVSDAVRELMAHPSM